MMLRISAEREGRDNQVAKCPAIRWRDGWREFIESGRVRVGGPWRRLLLRLLAERDLINAETLPAITGLSTLRNLAAHDDGSRLSVTPDRAREYAAARRGRALRAQPRRRSEGLSRCNDELRPQVRPIPGLMKVEMSELGVQGSARRRASSSSSLICGSSGGSYSGSTHPQCSHVPPTTR
jgi:hypothetical protein